MVTTTLRDYAAADASELGRLAVLAFHQFRSDYVDWAAMANSVSRMSELAATGEIIVAEREGRLVGGIVYVAGGKPKAAYFDQAWPIIRMLVVEPAARGGGIGRKLTEECVRRALRDEFRILALHTSPIMTVALSMYLRMGFNWVRDAPPIHGVRYAVYAKDLMIT
jgi:GNAT superfamily N-acetyltransferase